RVVGVVELHHALRDVASAYPDLCQAKPAVIAVSGVTYLHAPAGRTAVPRLRLPRYHRGFQHCRLVPIGGRASQVRIPSRRDVVPQTYCEWITLPGPVVSIP